MQLGEGVEWATHCCTVLALMPPGNTMPAARLAEFHGVAPSYLAKHLQALAQAGIVESVAGRKGGYRLARPTNEITLLQVVQAVEGDEAAFRCSEIRRRGPAAVPAKHYTARCAIAQAMDRAEEAWRDELAGQTIADIVAALAQSVSPVSIRKGASWFQDAMR
jgi:Rrf2 family protein